ncbi:MAG: hypothetical protein AAF735_05185 [Myxococcota bacterium]
MKRKVRADHYSLEAIRDFLTSKTPWRCSIEIDQWPTDGQWMIDRHAKCVVVKKSATAGAKVVLIGDSLIDIRPIAPSNFFNALTQRGLLAFLVHWIIKWGQHAVAEEVEQKLMALED